MMSHDYSTQTLVTCSCCDRRKEDVRIRFIYSYINSCLLFVSYGCCCCGLDDIPDPLRELNDDFLLQFGMMPAVKGSEP